MDFLHKQLFETPTWMLDKDILNKIESAGTMDRIRRTQTRILNQLMDFGRMARIIENESLHGNEAYTLVQMMTDLRRGIWQELYTGNPIDAYRRNLQRAYIDRLAYLMTEEQSAPSPSSWRSSSVTRVLVSQSDIRSVARAQLLNLKSAIGNAMPEAKDQNTRYHLIDAVERINAVLDPK